jgi:hypothetical protein
MPAAAIFQLAYAVYPAYNTAYKFRRLQGIAVVCSVRSIEQHERRKGGELMKRICSGLMGLFLAISPRLGHHRRRRYYFFG